MNIETVHLFKVGGFVFFEPALFIRSFTNEWIRRDNPDIVQFSF
jgi:hypothetical protein